MATLKLISLRLKAIKNIQKITKSMKLVSAAKYARAEKTLRQVRPYGEGSTIFYYKTEIPEPKENSKKLIIAVTSDRGLCGATHANIARAITKKIIKTTDTPKDTKIVCIGDKSRAILHYLHSENILLSANEIGRKPPIFLDACKLTNAIIKTEFKFNFGKIVYNKFKSLVSYQTQDLSFYGLETVVAAPKLVTYDSVDNELLQSYLEFSLASLIFYTMIESAVSEQASRMTAMDNATKNAGEMITKLSIMFNRNRQAAITRELIEIISGAAAL